MTDILNITAALLTIGFGAFGFLAPRYTASALDLMTNRTSMGLSEMRASVGGLFVAIGIVCLIFHAPPAYLMLGVAYAGAAAGRALSLVLDRPPLGKAGAFFAVEAALAGWLVLGNL